MCSILGLVQADPDIGKGSYGGEPSHLDVDDPDFSGVVDFSNAIPGTVQVFYKKATKFWPNIFEGLFYSY